MSTMPSERPLGKLSVERTLIKCVLAFVPCSSTVLRNLQSRRVRGGGMHWVHVHPPPHPGKKFRSEMSTRGEKVPPRYVGKKECARSAQIRHNINGKGKEKEEKSKRKGIKLKK